MKNFFYFILMLLAISCKEADVERECIIVEVTEPKLCTYQYQPVCGCNGVTYGNACSAESEGVMTYSEGKCK